MFLRNEKSLFIFFLIIYCLFSLKVYSATDGKTKALNYLHSLKHFSASFLQSDGEALSEGKVYIGEERVRAEYFLPSKILIILDENKAMYYNYELEEDEFFNPKDTNAWFFYDIFRNPIFFKDGIMEVQDKELVIKKRGIDNEGRNYLIKIFFEESPLMLRRIEISFDDNFLKLSIFNHTYNESFDKQFFKLINPKLLN